MLDALRDWLMTFEGRAICLGLLAIALAAGGVVEVYVGRLFSRSQKNVAILVLMLVLVVCGGGIVGLMWR